MIKVEGIVLSEMKYQENSKILRIYTKEMGKVSVMAKGAYNPKSKLISITQPFIYGQFILNKGKNFYYLSSGEVLESNYDIRNEIERLVYGSYILELLDKSSEEEQENKMIFNLLKKSIDVLSELDKDYLKFVLAYELKFISFIGYRPNIKTCNSCGTDKFEGLSFSISSGGILCSRCSNIDRSSMPISLDLYVILCSLMYSKLDELDDFNFAIEDIKKAHSIILEYILNQIDRKSFNSIKFMETMDME